MTASNRGSWRCGWRWRVFFASAAAAAVAFTGIGMAVPANAAVDEAFVSTWKTDVYVSGEAGPSSGIDQLTLPLVDDGSYDFTVDWGDLTSSQVTAANDPDRTHTYATVGTYTVSITGAFVGWKLGWGTDAPKLLGISNWGPMKLGNHGEYFSRAWNLTTLPSAPPDLTATTNLHAAFGGATRFNEPVGNWDTSKVTDMAFMFSSADAFNQPIGNWDTENVTDMGSMFSSAHAFNQPIADWNTGNVTYMGWMFEDADAFNQPIGGWDTSKVTHMAGMFCDADAFNQPIGGWDTGNVTSMGSMFAAAGAFNQPIGGWDTGNVTDMWAMFYYARAFDRPIGDWNTSKVTYMDNLFENASAFDQNVSSWDTSNVINMDRMFSLSGLSTANYDALLIGWSARSLKSNVGFSAGSARYSAGAAAAARQHMIDAFGWTITDGGQVGTPTPTLTPTPTPTPPPPPPPPASAPVVVDQHVAGGVPKKLKRKTRKPIALPKATDGGQRVGWSSATPKVCKVVRGKLKLTGKKGVCRLIGTAAGTAQHRNLRQVYAIRVR